MLNQAARDALLLFLEATVFVPFVPYAAISLCARPLQQGFLSEASAGFFV